MIDVPMNVAVQYSHKLFTAPESNAGAKDLAGFIEAPEINPKKKMGGIIIWIIGLGLAAIIGYAIFTGGFG